MARAVALSTPEFRQALLDKIFARTTVGRRPWLAAGSPTDAPACILGWKQCGFAHPR